MLDIIINAEGEQRDALIYSCDFSKCFDKVSFDALFKSLEYFQFGNTIINWTKIFYNKFNVKIQNNGYFSEIINIKRSVHQGGPASTAYFLTIAEILAINLRANKNIKGIPVEEIINILSQFADDLDIFSENCPESLSAINDELTNFHQNSGFEINEEKSKILKIGSQTPVSQQTKIQTSKQIKVLGIDVCTDQEHTTEINFSKVVEKSKSILNKWHHRNLSLLGKINVINTLIASLFVYKMMVLPEIPKKVVDKMEQIMSDYLWDKKRAKISMRKLQTSKQIGGANLVNLKYRDKSLKITWLQILLTDQNYARMVNNMICKNLQVDIWRCSLAKCHSYILGIKNKFWQNIVEIWCEYNAFREQRVENQIIWANSGILVNKEPIIWSIQIKKGLKYVYQLFENAEWISSERALKLYDMSIMQLNTLKSAVPKQWVQYFKEHDKKQYMPPPPPHTTTTESYQ